MQFALATGASLVVDVGDDFDPRQMRRQRSTVDPAVVSPGSPFGGSRLVCCRLITCRRLLDVFQAQQHLVFGQRFRPAAEAMALQLLDDLAQPFALAPFGQQHRFQRLEIVRQCIARHDQIRP